MSHEAFLDPISGDEPSGEDCGYSFELQVMDALAEYLCERAAVEELRRQSRQPFSGENEDSDRRNAEAFLKDGERKADSLASNCKELLGRNVTPALACENIDSRAAELLARRGKDLRVVKALAVSWLQARGAEGLRDAVLLFEALLERFPDTVHPRPDEDDPSDVSARAMVLSEIVAGKGFANLLRESVVLNSAAGSIVMRDAEVLDGNLDPDPDRPASMEQYRGVVRLALARELGVAPDAVTDDAMQQRLEALRQPLVDTSQAMDRLVRRFEAGLVRGDAVQGLVDRMARQLGDIADQSGASAASSAVNQALGEQIVASGGPAIKAAGAGAGGRLQTREDARRQILEICAFLEGLEPSHPAPLFLRRAERLLGARNYFELVRDMTPDALSEVSRITGHQPPDESY
ncbi:MAG: type VI secretion system ImpA family N-terminal domain-containing protein [Betaproteobacteria bacterium]